MASVSKRPSKKAPAATAKPRSYSSELRDDQTQQTRERIIDGLVAALIESPQDASIPLVARKARVSVPTVYRHFATRADLEAALNARVDAQLWSGGIPEFPESPAGLAAGVRELFLRLARLDASIRYLGRLSMWQSRRRARVGQRAKWIEASLAGALSKMPERERVMMRDVLSILCSSTGLLAFEDYLGLSPDEAADRIEWLIHTLADAGSRRKTEGGRR